MEQQNTQLSDHYWWCSLSCCHLWTRYSQAERHHYHWATCRKHSRTKLVGSPMINSVAKQLCYSCYRFCLCEQNSFPDNNIQEHLLTHYCSSYKSTKGKHIERIKPSNNNLQKPWSTCQLHTWWQWACMFKGLHWFHSPWHCSFKYSCTGDWKVQPNHLGTCANISAWYYLHKTANTICTTPDDLCCTLSEYFPMEVWSINRIITRNYNDWFSSPWLKQTQDWIWFFCSSLWCYMQAWYCNWPK